MTNRDALILRLISYDTAELAKAIHDLFKIKGTNRNCERCPALIFCGTCAKKTRYKGPMPCEAIIKAWLEAEAD